MEIKNYQICTFLKNFPTFNPDFFRRNNKNNKNKDLKKYLDDFTDYVTQNDIFCILCLKDKRIGFCTGINIRIFNSYNFKIDMIIPFKRASIFQYLKNGNIIVNSNLFTFSIIKISKKEYTIIESFKMQKIYNPFKVLELANNQIIAMSTFPYLEIFHKENNKFISFKHLYL